MFTKVNTTKRAYGAYEVTVGLFEILWSDCTINTGDKQAEQ